VKKTSTGWRGGRPMILATRGAVSSGHYLATEAGVEILRRGGNAADAAAGVGFALALLKPHQNGIGGEVPMLVYSADEGKPWALSGHGVAPSEASIEKFRAYGLKVIPGDGFLPAIVPPAVASWILLLDRFGTMRLADVLSPVVELAEQGFVMYDALHQSIAGCAGRMREEWPSSAEVFLPGGAPPPVGRVWRNPGWAATFRRLIQTDQQHKDRRDGLRAAHEEFYRGRIAERIVEFCRSNPVRDASGAAHAGLLSMEDFAAFQAEVEQPVGTNYGGVEVFKCGPWTQGPVLLQALNLLENFDLAAMGRNSAEYIHVVVECMKLAYADREFYYGDPKFVDVPLGRLLSKEYAAERAALVGPTASMELRPGGQPPLIAKSVTDVEEGLPRGGTGHQGDTTKLEVIDAAGNMVSATPSGGWLPSSPVIPGLGFPLGTRGQMFSLREGHPNCLQPGKRPRSTLTPSIATKGGRPFLAFGSPGGDCQDQWALEFLLNVVVFDLSLQEAVEAPTFWTTHFPSSFYPRTAEAGALHVETRVPKKIRDELARRGHRVHAAGAWAGGNTLAAGIDVDASVLSAAASPRLNPAYAAGW
jgi:gamma-glutamyltranspeptidase/glutathione hydrolase